MAFVEAKTEASAAGFADHVTIDRPTALAVGDLMVAFICNVETANTIDTEPTGWAYEDEFNISAAAGQYVTGWSKVATSDDVAATDFTWTWAGNQVRPMGVILHYTNEIQGTTHMDTDNVLIGNTLIPATYRVENQGPGSGHDGGIQLYVYAELRNSGTGPTGQTAPAGSTLRAEVDNPASTYFTHMVVYELDALTEDDTDIIWTGGSVPSFCNVGGGRYCIVGVDLAEATAVLEAARPSKLRMKVTHLPYDLTRTMTRP